MHTDIVLKHDETHRWCLDCHDADQPRLPPPGQRRARAVRPNPTASAASATARKYRDWRAGVHGRRTGNWNGAKSYLLCAHCHNPHQPRFHALAPKPAPRPPSREPSK